MTIKTVSDLINTLEKNIKNSNRFRSVINTRVQSLSVSASTIKKGMRDKLLSMGISPKLATELASIGAETMFSSLKENLKDIPTITKNAKAYYEKSKKRNISRFAKLVEAVDNVIVIPRGPSAFKVKLIGKPGNQVQLYKILQDAKREASIEAIKSIKNSLQKDLLGKFRRVTEEEKQSYNELQKLKSSNFIDLTHIEKGSVAELFGYEQLKLIEDFTNIKAYEELPQAQKETIDNLILSLKKTLKVTSGRTTKVVRISLGNADKNRELGRTQLAPLKKSYLKILEEGIQALNIGTVMPQLEGSDSVKTIVEKQILNNVKTKLNSSIKTSFKVKKIDKTVGNEVSKVISKSITSKGTFKDKGSNRTITKLQQAKVETKSFSPLEVLAYINSRLPRTIEKNMQFPGLEYQTGRFAQSVRAVNILETKQGFPSIEYSYQRDPYQVFEMGIGRFPWATPQRDPRKLIDRSIREIAVEMLRTRIYTRRT